MSPKDSKSGGIAQKWLPDTKVADMPPVGPSPILIHVDLPRSRIRILVSQPALERTRTQLVFSCFPLYSLYSYPLYSRGALKALRNTALMLVYSARRSTCSAP